MKLPAIVLSALLAATASAASPEEEAARIFRKGPFQAELGGEATLEVPEGYVFVEKKDMKAFLEMTQNAPDDSAVGALIPAGEDAGWIVYFEFDDCGYVKDDEKDELDGDKILDSLREGNEAANEYRRDKGWSEMQIVGWDQAPFYDPETHNLTWAVRGRSEGHDVVNYNSRILGRAGVMSANLACDPGDLAATVPVYKQLLGGFAYRKGKTYGEFKAGDKAAAYGLTALVAGGGAVAAAKLGLFAKLGQFFAKFAKLLVIGAVAAFAAVRKFASGLFGKKDRDSA